MDIDPAILGTAGTALTGLAGAAGYYVRKAADAKVKAAAAKADEAAAKAATAEADKTEARTNAKAYEDTRTDLVDCREMLERMAERVEGLESGNVVLTHALHRLSDQHADCQGGLAQAKDGLAQAKDGLAAANARLDAMHAEMGDLRRSIT